MGKSRFFRKETIAGVNRITTAASRCIDHAVDIQICRNPAALECICIIAHLRMQRYRIVLRKDGNGSYTQIMGRSDNPYGYLSPICHQYALETHHSSRHSYVLVIHLCDALAKARLPS